LRMIQNKGLRRTSPHNTEEVRTVWGNTIMRSFIINAIMVIKSMCISWVLCLEEVCVNEKIILKRVFNKYEHISCIKLAQDRIYVNTMMVRFLEGAGIFLFTTASRLTLGHTQSPIQRVLGFLSRWGGGGGDFFGGGGGGGEV